MPHPPPPMDNDHPPGEPDRVPEERPDPAAVPDEADRRLLARLLGDLPDQVRAVMAGSPARAPERLVLAACARHAGAAVAWVERRRAEGITDPDELVRLIRVRHVRLARAEGAAGGAGGLFTVVPDLVALAWLSSRMVVFIAAANGLDPHSPRRAAELLTLQGLYPDVDSAAAALAGSGPTLTGAAVDRGGSSRERAVAARLARLVGRHTAERLGGRLVPGIGVAAGALGNARATKSLAHRAGRFYADLRGPATNTPGNRGPLRFLRP